MSTNINPSVFNFLNQLKKNNNREWFSANKHTYLDQKSNVEHFADELIKQMNTVDQIETISGKKACFRIYRDVRFSKDKSPYKTNMGMHLSRATNLLRGGYYLNIEPGNCFAGGGFWGPNPADLKLIRAHLAFDASALRKVLHSKEFQSVFDTLKGAQVKTAPKGYAKDHKNIDLLRYKQFLVSTTFTDQQVLEANFLIHVKEAFMAMRPFFDCMSEYLTTDTNGVPLYE